MDKVGQPPSSRMLALIVLGLFVVSRIWMALILGLSTGDFTPTGLIQSLCQWDCGWYLKTANDGYDRAPSTHFRGDAANWAFFPLFPLVTGALARLTQLPALTAGVLVSNTAVLAAGLLAIPLLRDRAIVLVFCTLLYLGPFSFYFATAYTEGLFILLTLACFLGLARRDFLAAGLAGALMSGTRAVGVFVVFSLLLGAVLDHRRAGAPLRALPARLLGEPRLVLGAALVPLGLFVYMAFLHAHVGDALAFAHIQRAWDRGSSNPLLTFLAALRSGDLPLVLSGEYSNQWAALWGLVGFGLVGYLARLGRFPEALFAILCILVPISSGTVAGLPRYVFGSAPFLIALSLLLTRHRAGLAGLGLLVLLVLLNVALLVLWAQRNPSLM
jgi:hypothetical protein